MATTTPLNKFCLICSHANEDKNSLIIIKKLVRLFLGSNHQNALTKMLSPECPHQNALSRMPSPKCSQQNALTKMTSPSFQPPMASNVFRPGLMFLRSVNFLKEPLPQFSSRSLYSSRDLLFKQNQHVGRRESLKCPLCLSLPQIFIYFTSCCTSVETSKTIVKLLTIAGHFIPIL